MARAGVCGSGPSPNEIMGKLMGDDKKVGEFGPPLYLNDNTPVDVEPTLVTRPPCGSATIHEMVSNSCRRYSTRNAVGTRQLIQVHQVQEGAKTFEKLQLANEVQWMTYAQYGKRIADFASGLIGLSGLPPKERVVIYAETQRDWMLAALSSFSMSLEVVTIYATLGEEGALFGLNQTRSQVCVADGKLLKVLSKIAGQCPALRHVITMGEIDPKLAEKLVEAGKTVTDIEEVVKKGGEAPVDPRPPAPEDVAVLMYTSGTTGTPKGVLLTHANLVAGCAGFHMLGQEYSLGEDTVYLAYLPLAHIMEMIAEISMLLFGASLGYGSPHTLTTSSGVKLKRPESEGDAIIFKPTFMVFAPAVFEKIYKGVTSQVAAKGNLVKKIFNYALECGMTNFESGRTGVNPILNRIAFSAPQQALGGRVQLAVTGSAPLSPEIQKFMQTVLKAPVRQGYGLTENCACATVGALTDNMVKSVGAPQACTVIRLADWPEGLYMNSDKTRPDVGMSRGEVLVGGPCVCSGYYVDPADPDPEIVKKNEEDFVTIEGIRFFRTGDIGQITPVGTLQIIDRKKDLWKGPQGEYVALSKVEAALKLSPYVDIPMVYGKTGGDYPVAILTIMDKEVSRWAAANGLPTSGPEMFKHEKVVEEVMKSCKEKAKEVGLVAFEIPTKICLLGSVDGQPPWTPENDMLTAALKLKRPMIARAHAADIDAMY